MLSSKISVNARRLVQRRCMSIFDTENRIAEIRSKYYSNPATGADNPTWLKEPGDKIIFGIAMGGLAVGLSCFAYGLYSMAFGINKIK